LPPSNAKAIVAPDGAVEAWDVQQQQQQQQELEAAQ
jgi:hypothetical protein